MTTSSSISVKPWRRERRMACSPGVRGGRDSPA
jgi:hypothetical protein